MDTQEHQRLHFTTGTKSSLKNVKCIDITDNIPEHWNSLVDIARMYYSKYAYIFHENDGENKKKHIHLVCYDKGGTTLKAHCERFSSVVPFNFIEKTKSPRAMLRYLTHIDFKEKKQYPLSSIKTNDEAWVYKAYDDKPDNVSLFEDWCSVRRGLMTSSEFLKKYASQFYSMPFYQQIRLNNLLFDYGATSKRPLNRSLNGLCPPPSGHKIIK